MITLSKSFAWWVSHRSLGYVKLTRLHHEEALKTGEWLEQRALDACLHFLLSIFRCVNKRKAQEKLAKRRLKSRLIIFEACVGARLSKKQHQMIFVPMLCESRANL
jgi:hypothetical protein